MEMDEIQRLACVVIRVANKTLFTNGAKSSITFKSAERVTYLIGYYNPLARITT